jgi:polyphosphate glucokinase
MSYALGIDIGGTGIKGALVDCDTGELASERIKYDTPPGAHPEDVVNTVKNLIADIGGPASYPLGISFPGVVQHGVTLSAANVSPDWIGLPVSAMWEEALQRKLVFLNDADAAGFAELQCGAARGVTGLVIMVTLGTGIGSCVIYDGRIVPNTELGHLQLDGQDAEHRMSNLVRERDGLSFEQWGGRLTQYFSHLEKLFTPDLFVVGGGVSKQHAEFFPHIDISTALVPAELLNNAGIVGCALYALDHH